MALRDGMVPCNDNPQRPNVPSETLVKEHKFPALGSSWQLVRMAFLLPCSCCKLLGCYFGCCCCAASAAVVQLPATSFSQQIALKKRTSRTGKHHGTEGRNGALQ